MIPQENISTGYIPRELQAILHNQLKRFSVIVCHRRFGKTVLVINEAVHRALKNPLKNPRYAYLAPTYSQAKRVAWDYFKDYTKKIPGVKVNEAELRIDIPRPWLGDSVRFMLLGAENPGSLRGIYLDGGILDEYAEMFPEVWGQVIRPALADRKGWAIFIGTPKAQNHFYEIYMKAKELMESGQPEWFTAIYKASETGIIDENELAGAKMIMAPEEYEQEFECSFTAALTGAYYGKYIEDAENDNRITSVPYDPAVCVDTFWDLGIRDTTVIWFCQRVGQEIHWIDYLEENGVGLEYYAKKLKEKPYTYGEHVLPHDAAAKELGTGRSRQEVLRDLLRANPRVLPRQSIEDGIQACRLIIGKSWFDKKKCARGIEALKNYRRKWDSKNKIFMQTPLHNWASHGADAFRTGGMGMKSVGYERRMKNLPRFAEGDYNIFGGY